VKIHAFVDVYPHPFKPYFDAQFRNWIDSGHELRVTSLARETAPAPLDVQTVATLRTAPLTVCARILLAALTRPRRSLRAFLYGRTFAERLKVLVRDAQLPRSKPDVMLVHNLASATRFAYLKRVFPDVPLVAYYHGGELPGVPAVPDVESKRALACYDLVFSNTQFSIDDAIRRGALRTHRIPVGLRLSAYTRPAPKVYRAGGVLRLAAIGRASREKGFDIALRALAQLCASGVCNFTFTLIGSGPELPALKKLAADLNLTSRVRFLGTVPNAEIQRHMTDADALLLTSVPANTWEENQACVMQEAMLMGAIVIASDLGGVGESIPPEMRGFMFKPGQQEQLVAQILSLMKLSDSAIHELANAGHKFVTENYDSMKIDAELILIAATAQYRKSAEQAAREASAPAPAARDVAGS
jgi:glycosyltransferase involved in cell wall biosynthesis